MSRRDLNRTRLSDVKSRDRTSWHNATTRAVVSNQGMIFYGGLGVAGRSLPDFELGSVLWSKDLHLPEQDKA